MMEQEELKRHRTLTDEDVTAIVETLREEMMKQFYQDLGKGFWGFLAKTLITIMLVLAAWGAGRGGLPFGGHH
jgi:hypothetical protein